MALRPGGILYLDEMISPSRTYWNDETFAEYRRLYKLIPEELRLHDELPLPIQGDDPSEAIRSGEILEQLSIGFDIEHFRGYGGNILAIMCPNIRMDRAPAEFISTMIDFEKQRLSAGDQPFYAVIVAKPKRGLAGLLSRARYFTEPKMRRVFREAKGLLSPGIA